MGDERRCGTANVRNADRGSMDAARGRRGRVQREGGARIETRGL